LEHIEKDTGNFSVDFRRKPETLLATKFRFTPRHVLYGKLRPYLNKVAVPDFDGVCTTEIFPLLPKPNALDRGYLFAVLLSQPFVKWASQSVSGTNLPRLDPERLREYAIPLPSLPDQQRIAGQLEQADRLRRTRRYALELTDTFLPAAFLQLFGDPVRNERGWQTITLESASKKITDGEHLNPQFVSEGHPIVMAEQVEDAGVNLKPCKLVSSEDFTKFVKKCEPKAGDILIVSRGATIGRTCVVDTEKPFCLMGSVILIKPDSGVVNPHFLSAQLKSASFLRVLRNTSGASAQQAIYIAHLRDKLVIVPPLHLQQKFAALVRRVERLRSLQCESLRQAEHIFASLLHYAFTLQS
jgi:type I restriction enzyme S subunit